MSKAVQYAERWSVLIDQRDEDGFHGTEEWLGGESLGKELRDAARSAHLHAYEDSVGANTRKVVITVERERR